MVTRFARHLLVGGVGTLLYMGGTALFVEVFRWQPVVSSICSFLLLVTYSYSLGRFWVYETTQKHSYSIPRFLAVAIIGLVLSTTVMYLTVHVLEIWYFWGLVGATLIVPPTNFLLNFYWALK